jgi:lysophospholipase L1-like esterase
MHPRVSATLLLLAFVLPTAFRAAAAEPAPPPEAPKPPFRPYPQLPPVLWYDDFSEKWSYYTEAKPTDVNPDLRQKGNPCLEMGPAWDKNNKVQWIVVKPQTMNVKFPNGDKPQAVAVFFNVWIEETGEIKLKCVHKGGDYEDKIAVSKEKEWYPLTFKLGDMRNKASHAEPEHIIERMEIIYTPREKKEYKKVYIDDLLITTGLPKPQMVLPIVQKFRHEIVEMTKSYDADGYTFNAHSRERMKDIVKAGGRRKRNKTVTVFGPRPGDAAELAKGLASAAGKLKLNVYTFANGDIPDLGPTTGLEDARAFVASNVARSESDVVLLLLSASDAKLPGRPSEHVRLFVERAIEHGAIPIVCLPPEIPGLADKEKKDLDGFNNAVTNLCDNVGAPILNTTMALKSVPAAFDGTNLNAAGLEAVANLAATAIKHIDTQVLSAKR